VMTNAHVVKGASRVYVTLSDGTRHPAEVRITPAREKSPSFPIANLGNSDNLQAGDWVIAVGNPFGLENTVTLGIVSNTARPMSRMSTGLAMKGTMIQTDAAINPGNSGGPLCNEWGDVIGINTMIRRRANSIGFAVPINRVKECMSDLIEGKQVAHSFLGITHRTLTPDQAKTHNADPNSYPDNLPEVSGAMVVHVMPSTPAARAGLKRFDVIREASGKKINNGDDLTAIVDSSKVGEPLNLVVLRGDRVFKIAAMPADLATFLESQNRVNQPTPGRAQETPRMLPQQP